MHPPSEQGNGALPSRRRQEGLGRRDPGNRGGFVSSTRLLTGHRRQGRTGCRRWGSSTEWPKQASVVSFTCVHAGVESPSSGGARWMASAVTERPRCPLCQEYILLALTDLFTRVDAWRRRYVSRRRMTRLLATPRWSSSEESRRPSDGSPPWVCRRSRGVHVLWALSAAASRSGLSPSTRAQTVTDMFHGWRLRPITSRPTWRSTPH
jgi:hypothetical protein